ncbi:MAG: hypothetical protein KGJ86_20355, partial [Chloroflexota bacterium]|nr:hypothetical protein [Chloroflexota bacterium]
CAQYVYEADIRGFFDHLDHDWLMRMIELKVGDPWILRLIRKWLKAGILEKGETHRPEEGTPQGGPLSPLLANVYLHYVLDLWFTKLIRPRCRGGAQLVRYADDFLVLFEYEEDANRFAKALPERLAKFSLEVAPEKTRLTPFGLRFWRQGKGAAGSFDFLGFSHHLGTSFRGAMVVVRIPAMKSVRRFLAAVKEWLRQNMHLPPMEQQRALTARLRGFYQYFALRHCARKLRLVRYQIAWFWRWALGRRGDRGKHGLTYWHNKPWFRLPEPRLLHPSV